MENKPMNILLVNDDGESNEYTEKLAQNIQLTFPNADVTVVLPSSEKSGAGGSITLCKSQTYTSDDKVMLLDGSPVDCVRGLLSVRDFDLVISGPNFGSNLGIELSYSGTFGAAKYAALKGVPAIAISFALCFNKEVVDYSSLLVEELYDNLYYDHVIPLVAELIPKTKPYQLYNINIPVVKNPLEVRKTVVGTQDWVFTKSKLDETGLTVSDVEIAHDLREGTDSHAVHYGYVSKTKLKFKPAKCK